MEAETLAASPRAVAGAPVGPVGGPSSDRVADSAATSIAAADRRTPRPIRPGPASSAVPRRSSEPRVLRTGRRPSLRTPPWPGSVRRDGQTDWGSAPGTVPFSRPRPRGPRRPRVAVQGAGSHVTGHDPRHAASGGIDSQGAHRGYTGAAQRGPPSSTQEGHRPMDTKRNRVLVVDDEPSIVDAVATSLRYEGFEVEEAMTGRAALTAAQERPPDLIVLDVMLPDLDGLEVTRRLRTDGIRAPVLFLTARDSLEDKIAGLTVGGDDYVTKPFALAEIIARARALLRRAGVDARRRGHLAVLRPRDGRRRARGAAGRRPDPADGDGVQPAALLPSQSPPGALQGPDPGQRLALRLRRRGRTWSRRT